MAENALPDGQVAPTEPAAGPSANETDELAKDLPGLPLKLKRGRVDERGFDIRTWRHGDLLIPWSSVRGFRSFWHGSLAVEAQRPDESEVRRVSLSATRAQRGLIRAAWLEYVLRLIERDGELAGSYSLFRPTGQSLGAIGAGVVTAAFGLLMLLLPIEATFATTILVRLVGLAYLVAGVCGVVAGAVVRSRAYAVRLHWYRWRLTREGLTFWPYAEETRLEPGPEDRIAPYAARLGRFTVPLENLTFREHAAALLLAMGERAGARTRPLTWLQPSVLIVPTLVLWSMMIVTGAANWVLVRLYADPADPLFPMGACLAAVTVGAIAAHLVSRGRLRRALADGRAMLERLGW
ncbi:MAG: hypothetical protein ACYSU0_20605 [Planctomycetota bacterium]|jgi:hypothetical protein